jgi:hypothetical protein
VGTPAQELLKLSDFGIGEVDLILFVHAQSLPTHPQLRKINVLKY